MSHTPSARDPTYVLRALELLREARDLLRRAGARRSVARVRLAITTTQGALRHAEHWRYRLERQRKEE